jgi:hypothetical protein
MLWSVAVYMAGTRYVFSANAFQTAAGVSVTGQVQLQLSEYLQKGDMIFSKMLPVSNDEPLLSAGEVNVVATQNGQPVYLKAGSPFTALVPQTITPPANLAFFSGMLNADTTTSRVNWVQPVLDTSKHSYDGVSVVVGGGDTVSIISDSVAMCNADAFMTSPDYQTFSVTVVVNGLTLPQTSPLYAYAAYDNYNAVWPLGVIGSYTYGIYTEEHVPNIPVHFIVFTTINGLFYGGTLAATPTTGNNYTVTLNQVNPATFKTQLNAL